MTDKPQRLTLLSGAIAICRLQASAPVPDWARGAFVSITRTATLLSVMCDEQHVPGDVTAERGWRVLRIEGPIPFDAFGIVAALTLPLAAAKISIGVVSTFDTDYLLAPGDRLEAALDALRGAGHAIES